MEQESRVSPHSRLFEARHQLRHKLALETRLLELTAALPVDDFCHQAREFLQLGAGWAWIEQDAALGPNDARPGLDAVFYGLRPRNRYLIESEHQARQDALYVHAAELQDTGTLPDSVDRYEVEAFVAFICGYETVMRSLRTGMQPEAVTRVH